MNISQEKKHRFVLGLVGLSDMALGIFFALVALRIIPIFDEVSPWVHFLIGGGFFTSGTIMALFNLIPKAEK